MQAISYGRANHLILWEGQSRSCGTYGMLIRITLLDISSITSIFLIESFRKSFLWQILIGILTFRNSGLKLNRMLYLMKSNLQEWMGTKCMQA